MTTTPHYKLTTRKFNDAWAVVLYVVFTAAVLCFLFFQSAQQNYLELLKHFDMKILVFTFVYTFASFFLQLACLLFFPGPAMHAACIGMPFVSMAMALYSGQGYAVFMAVVFGILALVLYVFVLRKHIRYAAAIVASAANVIVKNIFAVTTTLVLSTTAFLCLLYFFCANSLGYASDNGRLSLLLVTGFFVLAWTFYVVYYFLRVFISSVVIVYFVYAQGVSRAAEALRNSLYAVGSICFGALIIAIVTVLRALVDRERDRSRGASGIFYVVALFLIDILHDLIAYSNEWAFCYVALTGRPYVAATKESWKIIVRPDNRCITNSTILSMLLGLFTFTLTVGYAFGVYVLVDARLSSELKMVSSIFLVLTYAFFANGISAIFDAGVKGLLFGYTTFPAEIRAKDEAVADAIEEQRKAH